MAESYGGIPTRYRESLFGAISAGFFFLLIGIIFITTPNLFNRIIDFFNDFRTVQVRNTGLYLPAPAFPRTHQVVYTAAQQFSYTWALFQLVILALRFIFGSPWSRKAETVSNFVFSIGAGYLIQLLLIETTRWFVFWSGIIMLAGVSLIVRAIVLAPASARRTA